MARPHAVSTDTHRTAHDAGEGPANEVAPTPATKPLKAYVLDAPKRAHYLAMTLAIDPAKLPARLPSHVQRHLDWMGAIQGTAWYDRAEIERAVFDGTPVTESDLDDLGFRIAFVREVIARAAVPAPVTSTQPKKLSDKALKSEVKRCQRVLCDAFVTRCELDEARGVDVSELRTIIQSVRRANSRSALSVGCVSLFALCDDATVVWLRALPKGEGAAFDRLREVHPEWDRRRKHTGSAPSPDGTVNDLSLRAYVLACELITRIVATGRYLIKGRADRKGDYPGYRDPKVRKVADVQPVATKSPPVA